MIARSTLEFHTTKTLMQIDTQQIIAWKMARLQKNPDVTGYKGLPKD